jgi:hypothetical protein
MLRAGGQTVEGCADQTEEEDTVAELMKKYPWWTSKVTVEGTIEAGLAEAKSVFEGRCTFI